MSDQLVDDNSHVLHGSAALAFPVVAAISITLLFFFLRSIGIIFTALSTISGFFALCFVVWPLADLLSRRLRPPSSRVSASTFATALCVVPAVVVIGIWLVTGNWIANDVIGISLCILFASLCKVQNLKVTAILFTGLFFYDIFFVFFSERFFGRNVMVEVATTAPTNPASAVASWLNLPVTPVPHLALPAKLIIPTSDGKQAILGLGDIILPEVLLTYLLEFDARISSPSHSSSSSSPSIFPTSNKPLYAGYFAYALVAYALAVATSFFCNYAFRSAQPALLYIVPAVLLTTLALGILRGHVGLLWNGLPERMGEELISSSSSSSGAIGGGSAAGVDGNSRGAEGGGMLTGESSESFALLQASKPRGEGASADNV